MHANLLRDLNRTDESIEAHRRLLELTKLGKGKALRLMHLEVQLNYANSLAQGGYREQAIAEKTRVVKAFEELLGEFPDDVTIKIQSTTASNNFGISQIEFGQHREALTTFLKAIARLEEIKGENESRDNKLATVLLNAGLAAAYVGDPSQARQFIERSLELHDALDQLDTQEAIRARITLGAILGRLNQYAEAAESYRLAVEQLRQLYPIDRYPDGTVDLAVALDNRSVSLVRLKQMEEARKYAVEANEMFAKLAKKSPGIRINYARSSANVALLNARLGRRAEAAGNLDVAIATYEQMFPAGHPELPGLYRSKAIVLSELRREQESIRAVDQALDLAEQLFPVDAYPFGHSVFAQTLDTAGVINLAAGNPEAAARHFVRAYEMQSALAGQTLRYISEAESLQFLANLDRFKSHLLSVPVENDRAYQLLAGDKARILDEQKKRLQLTRRPADPAVAELAARYEKVRTVLARLVLAPSVTPESAAQMSQLQAMREELERRIAEQVEDDVSGRSPQESGRNPEGCAG